MSRLEKFLAKPKVFSINGEDVEVFPLTLDDAPALIKLGEDTPDTRAQGLRELIRLSLKKSFPDASEEELNKFDFRFVGEFLSAVYEVSGLEVDKKKLEDMTASLIQKT